MMIQHRRPRRPLPRRAMIVALALMALLALPAGCTRYHDYDSFLPPERPLVTTTEYRLAPPDTIVVNSKRVREINGHTETIRPDGKITLPLLGSVFVAGKTCEEVSAELVKMATDFYGDADVSLRVASFNSKKIFVFGEVTGPGAYAYHGTNTVLETLARAQPTRLADKSRIQVLRPVGNGEFVHRMTIDLNKMTQLGDVRLDAVLEERDILYVPANALAAVGLVFQQLLLPIQPAASTFRGLNDIDTYAPGRGYGTAGDN